MSKCVVCGEVFYMSVSDVVASPEFHDCGWEWWVVNV